MRAAIIGGGAMALSSVVFLEMNGHRSRIWSALTREIDELRAAGRVHCEGAMTGTAPVEVADTPEECIADADVVILAAPAFAHARLIEACAPFIRPEQTVLINTATGLSSLLFAKKLAERRVKTTVVDLATSISTSRKTGPNKVRVAPLKPGVDLASIPAANGEEARKLVAGLFGDLFVARDSALAISLNNHNPVYHVPAFIFNFARVERGEEWNIWLNMTPLAAQYIQRLDDERMAVARSFRIDPIPLADYVRKSVGVDGSNLAELFAAAGQKRPAPTGPLGVDDRYMTEDMPYGMVFIQSLGRMSAVATPLTDHMIRLCSDLYNCDFAREGQVLPTLGLSDATPDKLIEAVRYGF
jgi:opine dehydrogenase